MTQVGTTPVVRGQSAARAARLTRRGLLLEGLTLGWNVVGVGVLAVLALSAHSPALTGFGLDSLVEIGASTVVVWELTGADATRPARQHRALRLIALCFAAAAALVAVQTVVVLAGGRHPEHSLAGIGWTALTALVMLALATGKARTGAALGNPVLSAEARVTLVDAALAGAVLVGLVLNAAAGWWWADPVAGIVVAAYAVREAVHLSRRS